MPRHEHRVPEGIIMDTGMTAILETAADLQRRLTETLVDEYDHITNDRFEALAETLKTRRHLERELSRAALQIARLDGSECTSTNERTVQPELQKFRSELERTQAVAVELGNRMAVEKQAAAIQLKKLMAGQRAVATYARQR